MGTHPAAIAISVERRTVERRLLDGARLLVMVVIGDLRNENPVDEAGRLL